MVAAPADYDWTQEDRTLDQGARPRLAQRQVDSAPYFGSQTPLPGRLDKG